MKSAARTIAYVLTLLVTAVFLSGCLLTGSYGTGGTRPQHAVGMDLNSLDQRVTRRPLTIVTKSLMQGDCRVKYPYVCDEGMDLLNISLHSFFMEFAADCEAVGGVVDYTVEFNNYGLLSLMLTCKAPGDSVWLTRTANFDCDTGEPVTLSDCFGTDCADYSARLGDVVARSMELNDYTPIGAGPEFNDSTQFLFTYGGILLVYREYEAFSYDAGAPRIKVKISNVMDLLQPDALLNRIK